MTSTTPSIANSTTSILNAAAYKFVELTDLPALRSDLQALTRQWHLKGTILLSPEGINLFVAGVDDAVQALVRFLSLVQGLGDLDVKRSYSSTQPYRRMLVKIKREIIAFGLADIQPAMYTSRKISPGRLCQWLDQEKDVLLLDVRNDYEIRLGTFKNAVPVGVNHFRNLAHVVPPTEPATDPRPVVMFCTGGIRCEKAGPFLEQLGVREVYQLDGGILKYFEQCGGRHFDGDCFVFDQRVAVNPQLEPSDAKLCFTCRTPLTIEDQRSDKFVPNEHCPFCYLDPRQRQQQRLERRQRKLNRIVHPLPGSLPYTNRRFITVPREADGQRLMDFLATKFPFHRPSAWHSRIEAGYVKCRGTVVNASFELRYGDRIENIFPHTIEPDVDASVRLLYEDDLIVVINKPAPLPMHPCGRFNRNSLSAILNKLYYPQKLRLAHRLDANTTGVVVFSRTKTVANVIQPQFQAGRVLKYYLMRVLGRPDWDDMICTAPIGAKPERVGARYVVRDQGLAAKTRFTVVERTADGTTLLTAEPMTGRTNQIRVHAWHLGFPVLGDPTYLPGGQQGDRQTLDVGSGPMCLHAYRISFTHPTDGQVTFSAPLPPWACAASSEG